MHLAALALVLAQAAAPAAPPAAAPAPKPAPRGPVVAFDAVQGRTVFGTITVAVDAEKAPISAGNFLKYVRSGYYEGTVFHRVIPDFMIQGGGFTPSLEEKPAEGPIRNEAKNGLRNSRGTVAMARKNDPDSADSQFFINLRDNHRLDYGIGGAGYAVFGEVIEGMDVVDRIAAVPTTTRGPHENVPQMAVVIRNVREVKAAAPAAAPPAAEP
ncbi:MAG TPA: peptidylprolyl isomerase, partial [Vicinamibacteria bacterium]|nr:peptidylprolyl isomerase [Vicinamibacteria bacterium]